MKLNSCYLLCVLLDRCDERIQKIQTIKMMEGIFICAAPHCLRSFLKKLDFEAHVHELHGSLLQADAEKEDGNESDVQSTKQQSSASESTLRGSLRSQQQQSREQQPLLHRSASLSKPQSGFGQVQNYPAESDNSRPPGFETASPKPGIRFPDYPPMNLMQPPSLPIPMNQNPGLPQQFGFPSFPTTDGSSQQFYSGAPYEMTRPEGSGSEQGSLLGYPPSPMMNLNFQGSYPPQSWNPGMAPAHTTQQVNRGRDGQGFGWQQENRDGFGQE